MTLWLIAPKPTCLAQEVLRRDPSSRKGIDRSTER
jgi:hypothetical protein